MYRAKVKTLKTMQKHYLDSVAELLPEARSFEVKEQRELFLSQELDDFLDCVAKLFPFITEDDLITLGSDRPSQKMIALQELLLRLDRNGFASLRTLEKTGVFWSGQMAKKLIAQREDLCSDMHVPAFCLLFALSTACRKQQGGFEPFNLHLGNIISKLYASHVSGVAHVYISSDKDSELPGLECINHFWHAELGQCQLGVQQGRVSDILIHRYDHHKAEWLAPLSLLNSEDQKALAIRRRSYHPLDKLAHKVLFKPQEKVGEARLQWRESAPRPEISYAKLRFFACKLKTAKAVGAGASYSSPHI